MADVGDSISRVVIDVDTKLKHIGYVKPPELVDVETSFLADTTSVLSRRQAGISGDRAFKDIA